LAEQGEDNVDENDVRGTANAQWSRRGHPAGSSLKTGADGAPAAPGWIIRGVPSLRQTISPGRFVANAELHCMFGFELDTLVGQSVEIRLPQALRMCIGLRAGFFEHPEPNRQ
jgi:hypothetical protein